MPGDHGCVQKFAEVALPLEGCWKRVYESGVDRAVVVEAVHVDEPERLAPLGNLRNRPAHGGPQLSWVKGSFLLGFVGRPARKKFPSPTFPFVKKLYTFPRH